MINTFYCNECSLSPTVRRSLGELQKANADTLAQHQALQERLKASEHRVQELQARLDDEGHGSSDLVVINQRLVEELEDEKARHQKDLEESDFTGDQTRKKYQGQLMLLMVTRPSCSC